MPWPPAALLHCLGRPSRHSDRRSLPCSGGGAEAGRLAGRRHGGPCAAARAGPDQVRSRVGLRGGGRMQAGCGMSGQLAVLESTRRTAAATVAPALGPTDASLAPRGHAGTAASTTGSGWRGQRRGGWRWRCTGAPISTESRMLRQGSAPRSASLGRGSAAARGCGERLEILINIGLC